MSIGVVLILVLLLHFFGWLDPVESAMRALLNPGSKVLYSWSMKIGDKTEEFKSVSELEESYAKIRSEYEQEKVDRLHYTLLEEENELLKEQLHFFASSTYEHIGAEVIGKNIEPLGSTLVLNRGSRDGIQPGQPVIVGKGILIGKIVRVEEKVAIVRLLNDSQSKIAATVMNRERSLGLVEGGYGISVRMTFVPQNETLTVGDKVITSGLEEGIPRGLFIGEIIVIEKEAYQPFQQAVITAATALDKISMVSILTQKDL